MWRILAVLCVLAILAPAYAGDDPETRYQTLLAAAKAGQGPVDWQALRFAYAETGDFDLTGQRIEPAHKKMFDAFAAGKFAEAISDANQILDHDYVDIDAHVICDLAYQRLGDSAKSKPHHEIVLGLLNSIHTGDGQTPETAMTVISVGEEYAVLRVFGLRRSKQSLIQANGHSYDKLDVTGPDGQQLSVYFLVDRVLAAEARALKGKQ